MAQPLAMTLGKALRRNDHSVGASLQSLARALARRTEIQSPLCRTCDGYFRTCRAEPQRGSPANDAHPEERRRQRARVEPVVAGTVATTSSALVRPAAGFRVPAGPENVKRRALRSAPPDARDRARHQPRSPARGVAGYPRSGGCGGDRLRAWTREEPSSPEPWTCSDAMACDPRKPSP